MNLRKLRRKLHEQRRVARKRFERHRRSNLTAALGPWDYVVVLDHLKPSFNIGKIFRSADAFGALELHLIGIDFFDPAPAMGSFKWVPARFHNEFKDCYRDLIKRGYTIFTLEPESQYPLPRIQLPKKSAFVFGHEEYGLSFTPADFPGVTGISIPQTGRVQSLNVSIAASLVMYEYLKQHDTNFQKEGMPAHERL